MNDTGYPRVYHTIDNTIDDTVYKDSSIFDRITTILLKSMKNKKSSKEVFDRFTTWLTSNTHAACAYSITDGLR